MTTKQPKKTSSKKVVFAETNEEVILEVSNTKKAFSWRLRVGSRSTDWTSHYTGILTIRSFGEHVYGVAMAYWEGVLPIEEPFRIAQGVIESDN